MEIIQQIQRDLGYTNQEITSGLGVTSPNGFNFYAFFSESSFSMTFEIFDEIGHVAQVTFPKTQPNALYRFVYQIFETLAQRKDICECSYPEINKDLVNKCDTLHWDGSNESDWSYLHHPKAESARIRNTKTGIEILQPDKGFKVKLLSIINRTELETVIGSFLLLKTD